MLHEQTIMRADGFRILQFIETDANGWLVDLWYELVDERQLRGPLKTPADREPLRSISSD